MKFKHIAIEGNIGSGKTSLAKKLAAHFNAKLVLEEFIDNPFLKDFYYNKTNALALELAFLNDRCNQLADLKKTENKNLIISDYHFGKSLIFAKNNLHEAEYFLFEKLYKKLTSNYNPPDLIIFLNCETETLLSRIKKRGREFEESITTNYLSSISKCYIIFLKNDSKNKWLSINSNDLNFVENEKDFGTILEFIYKS